MNPVLSKIFSSIWAIEHDFVQSQKPVIKQLILGSPAAFDYSVEREKFKFLIIDSGSGVSIEARSAGALNKAEPGSIAIIPIKGALMKDDQECGPVGTATVESWLIAAANNPNIESIILHADSPGGTVDGTESFSNSVVRAKSKKPVVAYVDGMAASACMWMISGADKIVINGETCSLGSIGTMSTILDWTKYLEDLGVKEITVYSPDSTNKNVEYREALAGNIKPMQNRLKALNKVFTSSIANNRAGKLNPDDENLFSGSVYTGSAAIKAGLADQLGSFDDAIQLASSLVTERRQQKFSSDNTMKKFNLKSAWKGLVAFFDGKAESGKEDVEVEFTPEKLEQLNAKVERVDQLEAENTMLKNDLIETKAELMTAQDEISRLKEDNSKKNAVGRTVSISTAETEGKKKELQLTGDPEADAEMVARARISNFSFANSAN